MRLMQGSEAPPSRLRLTQGGQNRPSPGPDAAQTASTATTPGTALMAPAIWGETLKRPGQLHLDFGRPLPASAPRQPRRRPFPAPAAPFEGSPAAWRRSRAASRRAGRPAAPSAAWPPPDRASSTAWMRARTSSPCSSADRVSSTALPGSSRSRNCCSPSENITASKCPEGSESPMMPILLPVRVRRSVRATTVPATRPALRAGTDRTGELGPGLHPHALERGGVVVERMAGEEEADGVEFLLQPLGRRPRARYSASGSAHAPPARRRTIRSCPALGASCARCATPSMAVDRGEHPRAVALRARRRRRPRPGFPARAC